MGASTTGEDSSIGPMRRGAPTAGDTVSWLGLMTLTGSLTKCSQNRTSAPLPLHVRSWRLQRSSTESNRFRAQKFPHIPFRFRGELGGEAVIVGDDDHRSAESLESGRQRFERGQVE